MLGGKLLNSVYSLCTKRCVCFIWQTYILHHFGSLMDNQTWGEEESVSKQELRSALLELACDLDKETCTQKAKALFKQYVDSNETDRYVNHTGNICLLVAQ